MRGSVSQFFVILPDAVAAKVNAQALAVYLGQFFPRYDFIIDDILPFDRSDYGLIPIAGVAGDGPGTGLFTPAPAADVLAILDALRSYGDGSKVMH